MLLQQLRSQAFPEVGELSRDVHVFIALRLGIRRREYDVVPRVAEGVHAPGKSAFLFHEVVDFV